MALKKQFLAILILVAFLLTSANTACAAPSAKLKIGAVLPLSGELSFLGQEVSRGIELAIEQAEKQGYSFEIVYEDDQSLLPQAAVNAARKLTSIDKVDIAVTLIVEESHPMAPIFEHSQIPLLLLWDSNKSIQSAGEYIFSNGFSTERAGEDMARFAYQKLGLRRIAVARHINPWADVISQAFQHEFEVLDGTIVSDQEFDVQENDFRVGLLRMKELNPDGIYFPMIPMNSAQFLIQAKQLGLTTKLLTGDPFIQDVIDQAGQAAEGVYYTNYYSDKNVEMNEKYRAAYNSAPSDVSLVSFGYQGIFLILEARKRSLQSGDSLRDSLEALLGKDRSANKIQKIYQVSDGNPVGVPDS